MRVFATTAALMVVLVARTGTAHADEIFKATLTGDQEVPAVDTITTGTIKIRINDDASAGEYSLTVNDGTKVLVSHIHCGAPGVNGPVIIFLANPPTTGDSGKDVDGLWVSNTKFTDDNVVLRTSDCGATLGDIIQAMRNGNTYANVHTAAHPGGEVRANIPASQ